MKLNYKKITECLLENDDPQMIGEVASILTESAEQIAEETDAMSYLMKLEEFLDDCGVYSFKGWEDAIVISEPNIEKFWVGFDFLVPKDTDLEASLHISGRDREAKVIVKKEGSKLLVRIKVLRRILDEIEFRNRKEAEKEAKEVANTPTSSPLGNGTPPMPQGGMPT
jgi:hypothetical protein